MKHRLRKQWTTPKCRLWGNSRQAMFHWTEKDPLWRLGKQLRSMRNSKSETTSPNNDDDSMFYGIKSFSRKVNSQVIIWTLLSEPRQKPTRRGWVANELDKIFGITGRLLVHKFHLQKHFRISLKRGGKYEKQYFLEVKLYHLADIFIKRCRPHLAENSSNLQKQSA